MTANGLSHTDLQLEQSPHRQRASAYLPGGVMQGERTAVILAANRSVRGTGIYPSRPSHEPLDPAKETP